MNAVPDDLAERIRVAAASVFESPKATPDAPPGPVTQDDFYAYMPAHQYLFTPSRELWPAASVNARCAPIVTESGEPVTRPIVRKDKAGNATTTDVPVKPAEWLDQNRAVDQMTWAPGAPMVLRDRLVSDGGWIDRPGCATFNLYRPPVAIAGDADKADPWLEHLHRVYGDDAAHIVAWCAHRAQRPGEKINHALVLGGGQGIGKDTLLEPVKYAVGPWNFVEVSPAHILGRFNGFVKSVILRISEARDLGDVDRFAFYDHTKTLTAAPPDVLRCDEKNLREHSVMNVTGVILTSNHKTDGLYLPADDRRHFVAWSERTREEFDTRYWTRLWNWYRDGGIGHVCAWLRQYDLSHFNPKAPPPKTAAFWDIADANRAPEDAQLADVIDKLGNPDALTIMQLLPHADVEFQTWLRDPRSRRQIPHRMEAAGYAPARNDTAADGLWRIGEKRMAVYGRRALSVCDRAAAAAALARSWQA